MQKIAIIGAGASGSFAAINAKTDQNEIYLFDKNEKIGKKIYITGKGRCNITNAKLFDQFLDNIVVNKKFIYSAFSKFDNYSLMDFCQSKGLELDIQRGDRVFPKSEKSSDVIKFLEKELINKKVNIRLNEEVKSAYKNKDKFYIKTDLDEYDFDKLVIATGGLSYPSTGSTGDGYKFAKNFEHSIIEPVASLLPILVKDEDIKDLEAISLKNINLHVDTDTKSFDQFGDLLFSKNAITGPTVLTMSALINREKVNRIYIDLKPSLNEEKLDKRILRDFDNNPNQSISNNLKRLLLNAFIPVILNRADIEKDVKCNQITKAQRKALIENIKYFDLKFLSLEKISRAVVSSGGVDTKEINPKTMESKLVKGLYFIGEVIDIDALTGGYNLQLAFSSAYQCADALKENR